MVYPKQEPGQSKEFKVASVSSNMNSFGLTGVILVARDGEAWQVGASVHCVHRKGAVLVVPLNEKGDLEWARMGFELPERLLPNPPPGAIAEIWGA